MFVLLLLACNDVAVKSYNTAPATSIVSPEDGTQVDPGGLVDFYGIARDEQDAAPDLEVRWESSIDGVLSTAVPDLNGDMRFATNVLSAGDHVITLTAIDSDGDSGSMSVALTVGEGGNVPGAPVVVVLSPAEGAQIGASAGVTLLATIADDLDASDLLAVEVVDIPDGVIFTGYPSAAGTLEVPYLPSLGVHTLTVNALDLEGKKGSGSVSYEVIADNVPVVNITSPISGTTHDTTDLLTFQGTVSDDNTAPELITVEWASDVQGVLSTALPDSSGATTFGGSLSAGLHTLTLKATDNEGNVGRDTITLTIEDPLARDDDGDGYTEYAGDCDDTDDTLSPAETDICNDVDEDCDGYLNDPYWDSYESNDTQAAAYNFGEVDGGFLWSGDSLEIAGLTFSASSDDDWFYWEADDEIYDNVEVQVVVSGLHVSGDYKVELYDGGGTLLDSDSGDGSITATFTSDVFDTGDDEFYVRVTPISWPSASCTNTYKLKIKS